MSIQKIIRESTLTADNSLGRPSLVSITKALNHLIYDQLVAIQPTDQPVASIFGIKYNNPNKMMTFKSPATYGGLISSRDNIADYANGSSYKKGDVFKYNDVVYSVTTDNPFASTALTVEQDILNEAVINGTIRYVSDAAPASTYEGDTPISDVDLSIDKWQVSVGTRKLKTEYTLELLQDMAANKLLPNNTIQDMLASAAALEINKDIIQKIITVSSRYKVEGVSDKGILDVSTLGSQEAGRQLYRYIAEMNASIARESSFSGTYVLASTRVIAILDASGLLKSSDNPKSSGKLANGLEVYSDITTPMDYMVVGVKYSTASHEETDDNQVIQNVGSLFFAPYVETDKAGIIKVVIDPNSLQEKAMIMTRYALSVNPFTTNSSDVEAKTIKGDDWDNLVGVSKMSSILGVKLAPLSK